MKLKLPNFGSLCKENILVNGDFQINPRGQSSYVFGEYSFSAATRALSILNWSAPL